MIDVMAAGGFSLTKFKSTSQDVLDLLSADECEKSTKQMEIDKEQVKQTLGISWRINDDCITFSKSIAVAPAPVAAERSSANTP